ncbi:Dynein heavy chain 9, axonemal [Manis javanica]|nr:Dynein heavy chain 9, axonemal [Manis javanica]
MESAEGKCMIQKYEAMLSLLEKYETSLYDDWCQTVSEKSQYNLSQPLLQRDPEMKQITVNFNPQENLGLFSADPASNIWKTHIKYIDDMLLDGLFLAIECSLKYLLENTECRAGLTPIFEAQLSLAIPELVFYPSVESRVKGGFHNIVEGLVTSIFGISSLVPQLSPQNGSPHYQVDVEGMARLASMRSTLMERVQSMMALCCSYRNTFSQYSYLYVEDPKEVLSQFLLYGRVLTPEEIEAHAEDGIPENPPLLHQFKSQIDSYEKLYEDVCRLEPIRVFESCVKIDVRPFKASLLNVIKKWSLMFKQHPIDYVTDRSCLRNGTT